MQNGEVIVRPTLDIIRNGSKRWRATAVGYFLGKRPYFYHLKEFAMSVWPDLKEVTGTNNGFFFLQFKSVAAMEDVIEGGPWLFQGQPIVLQKWEPGMVLRKLQHTQIPVWIKLPHLLVELWTDEGLSTVASGVGKPLYPDAITRACTRLDFARVCVMLDVTSNLPKHIIIMTPDEDGGESPCKVDVENHPREEGDTTYKPSRPTNMPDRNMSRPPPARVVEKQREGRESPRDAAGPSREERVWNVRGLNKRDHQLAVKDIVAEFRLQFLGLLETHVRINNVSHIQAFLLPQWKWFVDYGSSDELVERRALWESMEWMKGGDQCSRVFFRKIAQRRSARRILQINDDHGAIHTDPGAVINEFVMYYQNLLGGERRRDMIDLRFLRPWARHILSEDDVNSLVLPFTHTDVKQAIFDIAEDKAPGPDGYSSGFFKTAWPIIGQEVSSAVLDFFHTGRILKQINTTLLALIPKVHSPMNVGDFRPISCCNVLYKIIAKLLVQRLSVILDKLISPCQAAFVPGRSIGDNIMLAQELFTAYNQTHLPPRCALKVDIRKAYDTVEWDFLIAVMELFGFPHTFVKWIEECVTTPSFSVGLNGKPHGFFTGARGLRQEDPLSPYLFVLVMEVLQLGFLQLIDQDELFSFHWKCDAARIFQLGFADDLLLFCRADMNSIGVFKTGLDRFAEWSGLRLNVQKSHLIISRSAQGLREEMLEALGFQEGVLPMRYLGLPLLSSRLTVADCNPLLLKIDKRIAGWEGMALSYAGRVQIIKSVLLSLSLYWSSAFILPKKVTNEIEKRLRTFLWKGTTNSGHAKVAWKDLCRPKDEGGIGFKYIAILNHTLMTKKLFDIIRCDRTSIWVEWLYQGRLRDTSIWTIRENGGSWGWRKILRLRAFLRPMVDYQIGDGRTFYLWQDPWHYLGPLSVTFPRGPRLLRIEESARLSTVISEGEWQWPPITDFECLEITHGLPTIHGGEDRIIWRFDQGKPTTQALYRLFDPPGPKANWLQRTNWRQRHMATYSFSADLVDSVSQLSGEWYDILGPIETGKRILNGLPKNGETSDHLLLVLHGDRQSQTGGMFRFDNHLTHSPEFIPSVQNIWQNTIVGVPMFAVTRKLKALKPVFREQRRKKGDLTLNVQLAKGFLDEAQQLRRVARRILQINDDNRTIHTEPEEIINEFVCYYQNLLGGNRRQMDIAEDKTPGPDGYSLGFFKAAWPVVGQEVTKAELLTGYNQVRLPPRCTLKVDIRKAYDTVEWDFLHAVLQLIGFPQTFTRWIEECVTTAAPFIGLNGNPHGFFAGARGLRQGDPLSPYLFVLVMEVLHLGLLELIEQDLQFSYHWKCEPAKVFQLGFADDLLLFCRADLNSLRIQEGVG
ncbi:UNVERIFIED_CONTAM: hypothetical protein Sindi_1669300 [Sesamum indicum]